MRRRTRSRARRAHVRALRVGARVAPVRPSSSCLAPPPSHARYILEGTDRRGRACARPMQARRARRQGAHGRGFMFRCQCIVDVGSLSFMRTLSCASLRISQLCTPPATASARASRGLGSGDFGGWRVAAPGAERVRVRRGSQTYGRAREESA